MLLASVSMHLRKFQDFFALLQTARQRSISHKHYAVFQEHQAKLLINYFAEQNIGIQDKLLLDLACGLGGYSVQLRNKGANVIALDLDSLPVDTSLKFLRGDALKLPFQPHQFDIILCASLIEHIQNPQLLIDELDRVIAPGGVVYLSFPPFYSLPGGHQFAPFHYLGERISTDLAYYRDRLLNKKWFGKILDRSTQHSDAFGNWGLYKLTIRRANQLIMRSNFRLLDRSTRWLPLDFSGVPILGEVLTWHVQYLLQYPKEN